MHYRSLACKGSRHRRAKPESSGAGCELYLKVGQECLKDEYVPQGKLELRRSRRS